MSNLLDSEIWRDDENGQTITITCDSFSALAEIVCMGKQRKEITLEVSQRARSKLGIGIGPSVPIFVAVVKLSPSPSSSLSIPSDTMVGRVWLPPGLVRHFREYFYAIEKN
jgi:hypothetical protein